MSRQTLSGATRSASVLAGSPSKSMIFQPSGVCRVCPRWKSPCTRWTSRSRPASASKTLPQTGARGRPGRARPRRRRPAARAITAATPAARPVGRWGRPAGARRGSRPAPGPSACASAREVGARPAGRAAPGPSRRSASASFSTTMARSAPSVVDRPVASTAVQLASAQPNRRATSDVAGPGQGVVHLDVEVAAQLQAAEQLQHRHVAEHHRGVALLAAEHRRLQVGCGGRGAPLRWKRDLGLAAPGAPARPAGPAAAAARPPGPGCAS